MLLPVTLIKYGWYLQGENLEVAATSDRLSAESYPNKVGKLSPHANKAEMIYGTQVCRMSRSDSEAR